MAGESATMRRERLAERDQYIRESDRRAALVRLEQEAAQAEAQAVERRAAVDAAQQQAQAERDQRRKDWGVLTVAAFDHDFAEARSALAEARQAFSEGVVEPGANPAALYLALAAAGARFTSLQERHRRALAASGAKQDSHTGDYEYNGASFRTRSPHIGSYAQELENAVGGHAARLRAEAEDAVNREQAAAAEGA